MIYTEQPEIILTTIQLRIFQRLLAVMTIGQVEQVAEALEEIEAHGSGDVTLKVYHGHPRFIVHSYTSNWLREHAKGG